MSVLDRLDAALVALRLRRVGDDGMTARERRQVADRYLRTVGRTPTGSPERTARLRTVGAAMPVRHLGDHR